MSQKCGYLISKNKEGSVMERNGDGRETNHTHIVTFVFVLVLIVLTAITLFAIDRKGSDTTITTVDAWVGIAFVCFVFLFLIYLGCMKDGTLSKGELRRAVAGSLVLAFTLLALFSIVMGKENEIGKEIVIAYIQLVGIAVGFYFGAKTAEKEEEDDAKPGLNDAGKATAPPRQNPEKPTEE
jgi:hypothetical protein